MLAWLALAFLLADVTGAWSQEAPQAEDWKARRERLSAKRAQMRQMRIDAQNAFNEASNRCMQEIANFRCLETARSKRAAVDAEALRLEKAISDEEGRIKREARAEKEANIAERDRRFATNTTKQAVQARNRQEKAQLQRQRGTPIGPRGPTEPLATDLIENK